MAEKSSMSLPRRESGAVPSELVSIKETASSDEEEEDDDKQSDDEDNADGANANKEETEESDDKKDEDATGQNENRSQQIVKDPKSRLKQAVKKTTKQFKLFDLYQQLKANADGANGTMKSNSVLTIGPESDDEADEAREEEIEFQRQQRRKRVKLMLIQSSVARNLTDAKLREQESVQKELTKVDRLKDEFNVSTPQISDNYVSRKQSLDRIVNEFLESSSFNLGHTAGLVSADDYAPREASNLASAGRRKKLAIEAKKKDKRGSIIVTEEESRSGDGSDVWQQTEYDDEKSLLNDFAFQSDYFLAGRKRESIFKALPASVRFYKIARCIAILCVFFQFRSNAQTPAAFRGLSFLTSADPKKHRQKNRDNTTGAGGQSGAIISGGAAGDSYLSFNAAFFKAGEEISLKHSARHVLNKFPEDRTRQEKHETLRALRSHLRGLIEYPIRFQHMLVTYGMYAQLSPSRVLIKQGHTSEWFYMILSGTVSVQTHPDNDMSTVTLIGTLGRGETTGEIETLTGSTRTATMVCKKEVEVIGLARDEFCSVFLFKPRLDAEYTYVTFLKSLDLFSQWAGVQQLEHLSEPDFDRCFVSYFKRGTVIADDYKKCKYIYVILNGKCTVTRKLNISDEETPDKDSRVWQNLPLNKDDIRKFKNGDIDFTVSVRSLYTGDSYGLEGIVYRSELEELGVIESTSGGSSEAALVSESCECVLIDKAFFLKHFNDKCKHKMQSRINLYTEKAEIVDKLSEQEKWRKNRHRIVKKTLSYLEHKKKYKTVY